MKSRILALLLIISLIFCLSACKSSTDEESATTDALVENTETDEPTDEPEDEPSDEPSDDEPEDEPTDEPTDDEPSDEPSDEPEDEPSDKPSDNPSATAKKYQVTLDYNFDNLSDVIETEGELKDPDIKREGYELDGWYKGNSKWDFSTKVTSKMTLKAKWNPVKYTIIYNANGAKLEGNLPKEYTADDLPIVLGTAKATGKVFYGWSINTGEATYTAKEITSSTTGNLTLSPVWDDTAIAFGKYEQDGDTSNGEEPIEWNILKKDGNKALVISKYILDAKQYDKSGYQKTWIGCDLHNWLNGSFYKTVFTSTEQNAIIRTVLSTPGQYDGSKANDYVFLLSLEEVKEYFSSNHLRRSKLTQHAIDNGAQNSPQGGWWWLRTKISDYGAALIENDGNIRAIGYTASMTTIGVRPAMWIDLSKLS